MRAFHPGHRRNPFREARSSRCHHEIIPAQPQVTPAMPAQHPVMPRVGNAACSSGRRQGGWCVPGACRRWHLLQPEAWSSRGGGDRLPSWAQGPGRQAGQRTCPQARCGSCGGAGVTSRRSPSTGTPSGCRSWRPSATAMAWTGPSSGCRAARFTWRSSGPGRHRTRAAGWTSSCSTDVDTRVA
jgi:hypothetical protein